MKNGLALVVALAGAAALAADNTAEILKLQSQLPACSIRCLAKGAAKFGCQPTDVPCQCLHAEDMTNEVAPCLVDDGCSLANITSKTPSWESGTGLALPGPVPLPRCQSFSRESWLTWTTQEPPPSCSTCAAPRPPRATST